MYMISMNTANQKPKQEQVYIYEFTSGDFNDVFERKTIRATESQMEKYVKDQFSSEGWEKAQDMGSDSICYGVFFEDEKDLSGQELEQQELRLEFYVEAINMDRDYDNADIDLDLTNNGEGSD